MGQTLPEVTNYIPKAECPGSSDPLRAGFKGAQGARAPGLPPTEGLPPNPS